MTKYKMSQIFLPDGIPRGIKIGVMDGLSESMGMIGRWMK